ncbi:uncharacterized protein LOC108488157 [Gossypium arboreum]|uniref:uncharacterized protein LOC108488157 n=1 Tax=Gossypium arboreum TaxID=29729 RepID=UPI0008195C9C|nr:uncharacterized protein LOC108488157 [Gossypium arboreum]
MPIEEEMCIRFEEGLNDDIRMMIGGNELRKFVVLSDYAQKLEEVYNRKMQRDKKSKESFKRGASKSFSALPVKKSREEFSRATSMPKISGKSRSRQFDSRTFDILSSATGAIRSGMRESASRSDVRTPARTYTIRAREEATALDVIAGTFYLYDDTVYALVDPGSTHICTMLASEKNLSVEPTDFDVQISLKCQTRDMISVGSENLDDTVSIISAFSAQRLLRKGNEAFLAYILDTLGSNSKLEQMSVVNEFPDVFPKELPGLPPDREVEFGIDVIPRIAPISVTLYRMAPAELKELKTQL